MIPRLLAACVVVALVAVLAWLFVKANAPQPLTPPRSEGTKHVVHIRTAHRSTHRKTQPLDVGAPIIAFALGALGAAAYIVTELAPLFTR